MGATWPVLELRKKLSDLPPNTPETIRAIRSRMNLTQTELADIMGYKLRAWQMKENTDPERTRFLVAGEFQYLLLLAGEHPDYELIPRNKKPA